jgi:hypothetical protein
MDPDPDPGGLKTYGSGSATLVPGTLAPSLHFFLFFLDTVHVTFFSSDNTIGTVPGVLHIV